MSSLSTFEGGVAPVTHRDGDGTDGSPHGGHRVLWAGGRQARNLADALSGDRAIRAGANLATSCVDAKADLLVLTSRTSFDLCSVAVPHGFDRSSVRSIVAAVGGGPHSSLAAVLADSLSRALGVPGSAIYGYSHVKERAHGGVVLDKISARLPHLSVNAIEATSPAALVDGLPAGTLLILGAPGGSWFQRRFFGPGARIRSKAPGGMVVVTHNRERVYQVMRPPIAFGPNMRVGDALQLSDGSDVAVAERGVLLGSVTAEDLRRVRRDLELHQVMEVGIFLSVDDEIAEASELLERFDARVVPVVDGQSRLVGRVSIGDLSTRSMGWRSLSG